MLKFLQLDLDKLLRLLFYKLDWSKLRKVYVNNLFEKIIRKLNK